MIAQFSVEQLCACCDIAKSNDVKSVGVNLRDELTVKLCTLVAHAVTGINIAKSPNDEFELAIDRIDREFAVSGKILTISNEQFEDDVRYVVLKRFFDLVKKAENSWKVVRNRAETKYYVNGVYIGGCVISYKSSTRYAVENDTFLSLWDVYGGAAVDGPVYS